MASSANKKKTSSKRTYSNGKKKKRGGKQSYTMASQISLMFVFLISFLMLLANFGLCGQAGKLLINTTFGLFGVLGYIVPIVWIVYAGFIYYYKGNTYLKFRIFMSFLLLVCLCAICTLIGMKSYDAQMKPSGYFSDSLKNKNGGGFFGGLIVYMLYPVFGCAGAWIILIVLGLVLLMIVTEFSAIDFFRYFIQNFRDSYSENKELREIKQEKYRMMYEARQEENRKRNADKMLNASRELSKRTGRKPQRTQTDLEAGTKVKNPLGDAIDTYEPDIAGESEKKPAKRKEPASAVPDFLSRYSVIGQSAADAAEEEGDDDDSLDEVAKSRSAGAGRSRTVRKSVKKTEAAPEQNFEDKFEQKTRDDAPFRNVNEPKISNVSQMEMSDYRQFRQPVYPEDADNSENGYVYPSTELLAKMDSGSSRNNSEDQMETSRKLQQTLSDFGVRVKVINVSPGPAVTRYELAPEQGVKVSKIVALQDDIKLNLAAADIRIEAPIPGKAAIGIEVPNKENVTVGLRDILESSNFRTHKSKLAFAVGEDIGGQFVVGDIAKMPHLLIAGATGSGKSVCINTIIISILFHAKPSEVKLLMIDPKVVELSVYNGIPHLLKPVVTDAKQAASLLLWAVSEMTDRYNRFAESGVRDIKGYNTKIKETYKDNEEEMPKLMPHIVIIVDELADLMMASPNEVEDSIMHLAQMARAAGMHLILATQRPSVNVITGVIKANIPSRIAFAVSSGVDSRTILDMAGAEKLLGKGDMLYYPMGMQKPIRVQGAFVTDKEVSAVVDFLKEQNNEVDGGGYDTSIDLTSFAAMTESKASLAAELGKDDNDPLFRDAGNLIVSTQKASIGSLQRKFRIGFNRAARIMDQLCEAGVVGEEVGTKARDVLMSAEEFENYCNENLKTS